MVQTLNKADLQKTRQGIGNRLRTARMAQGLTQAELGRLAGFDLAVVQDVEDGVLWHPSVVSGLAVALDVTPAWILWGEPFTE